MARFSPDTPTKGGLFFPATSRGRDQAMPTEGGRVTDDLEEALGPHIPALRRFARGLLRDTEAADDLVQDCLLRAISRWHLRWEDGALRAWLFTILYNLFVS